jgi:hypothetical protein
MNLKNILTVGVVIAIAAGILFARGQAISSEQPVSSRDNGDVVTVYKTEACGCCLKWVDHLKANGLEVDVVNVASTAPTRERFGVPSKLLSCHTGTIHGYWVEGHVPADLVKKLIAEKPDDIRGISAPGMPMGSPGMEGPNPVQYDIVAYHADGTTSVYATRQGKETVE